MDTADNKDDISNGVVNDDTTNDMTTTHENDQMPTEDSRLPSSKVIILDLIGKILFFIASILYVIVAVVTLDLPLQSSKYLMLSLVAAFLFAVVGVLDLAIEPRIMGGVMILAGVFGVLSVAVNHSNQFASQALNSVSVHLFVVEAVGQFIAPRAERGWWKIYLRSGDVFWILGSSIDVILSYILLLGTYGRKSSQTAVLSAVFWLLCSVVYVSAAIVSSLSLSSRKDETFTVDLEMTEEVVASKEEDDIAPESKIV